MYIFLAHARTVSEKSITLDKIIRVFLLPIMSQNFVRKRGPIIPPNGTRPVISATWIVVIGFPRGFISVLFDFSFHITGDVQTILMPTPTNTRQAEKNFRSKIYMS